MGEIKIQEERLEIKFLKHALRKASESMALGGFPAGAVIVKDSRIIGEGISIGHKIHDPTSHGEMAAIRDACKNIQQSDLKGAVLYSSMQPCIMCLGAAMWGSVSEVFYACSKDKVSPEYYGGHYRPEELAKSFLAPFRMQHVPEMEQDSLDIVKQWEASLK